MDGEPNFLTREDWFARLCEAEPALGLSDGFKFLCGPWSTRSSARVAFLSLKPGRPPDDADLRVVSDERGNSYRVERATTHSPITEQFLALAEMLGEEPDAILAGFVAPFRAIAWTDLDTRQQEEALALGRAFWTEPLNRADLQLIVACSRAAAELVCAVTRAVPELEVMAGWGNLKLRRHRTHDGRRVILLPHLSRFRLLGRPTSEAALREILQGEARLGHRRLQQKQRMQVSARRPGTRSEALSTDTAEAIAALSGETHSLFREIEAHPDFACEALKMQLTIWFRNEKVGGLNRRSGEWYVSKVFVRNHGGVELLQAHGFKHIDKDGKHQYWAKHGIDAAKAYRAGLEGITGAQFNRS